MSKVAHRTRGKKAERAHETQGVLAIQELNWETGGKSPSILVRSRGRTTQSEGGAKASSPPQPLPHRMVLATWPDHWRERWGRRANALEDLGLSWRDAEGRAFFEIWNEWRSRPEVVERN